MQFVANGPDIPETLLQAHEDGRVVFFCGAGISFPAGLPGFGGLTGRIFDELGVEPKPPEKAAMAAGRFDVAIETREKGHPPCECFGECFGTPTMVPLDVRVGGEASAVDARLAIAGVGVPILWGGCPFFAVASIMWGLCTLFLT